MTMYLGQEKQVGFHPAGMGETNGEIRTNKRNTLEVGDCVAQSGNVKQPHMERAKP